MTPETELAAEAVQALRRGEDGAAWDALGRFADALGRLAAAGDPRLPPLLPVLEEIFACQQRGDLLRIADLLAFVVTPALLRRD
ncbi:MAG: hypothetical protein RLZZ299_473 [Pseudomonadota bacterium]|jgi:hypothetical protein